MKQKRKRPRTRRSAAASTELTQEKRRRVLLQITGAGVFRVSVPVPDLAQDEPK
jgi:hypothetical protein